jgi:hypothetical protein
MIGIEPMPVQKEIWQLLEAKSPKAEFIADIEVDELMALDLEDLPVERSMLVALAHADTMREVFIINGLEPGNLMRVLAGGNPGTRIYRKS